MSGDKRARVHLSGKRGTVGFAGRENEPAIGDASPHNKTSLIVSGVKKPGRLQAGSGICEFVDGADGKIPMSSSVIQDSQMSFELFVETKFVPEHVQYKTQAGQTHYQAMLKHVITPEAVSRIFNPAKDVRARLRARPGWPYLDATRICDLRPEHIRRIVAAAEAADYSAQTVKHIKNVCFAIIAHAQNEGCFNGPNPASLVKLPKLMRIKLPALSALQAKALLNLLQYPHREAALFALTTGLSLPEICDLRWKDVNLEPSEQKKDGRCLPAQSLLVNAWWNRAGLGDSRASSKSKVVEIREPLLSTLRDMRSERPCSEPDDLVLTSERGDKIIPASFWVNELKRVAKVLGISRLTWQDLRRTHQLLSTELWARGSHLLSWSSGDPLANYLVMPALSRREALNDDQSRNESELRRRSCYGRRLRISSGRSEKPVHLSDLQALT